MSDNTLVSVQLTDGRTFGPAPMATVLEWARQGRIPSDAMVSEPDVPPVAAGRHPLLAPHAVVVTPPTAPGALGQPEDTGLGRLIPSRNTPALVGYYMGIFSFIPAILLAPLGVIAGAFTIWLGIKGLKVYKADPSRHGRTHAIVAIIGGSGCILLGGLLTFAIVMSLISKR